jgi:hypothetical protein
MGRLVAVERFGLGERGKGVGVKVGNLKFREGRRGSWQLARLSLGGDFGRRVGYKLEKGGVKVEV